MDKLSKFIYFPSFSAGAFGNNLEKDFRFKNGMGCRFYTDEYEDQYRHNQILITAGVHFKKDDYRTRIGLTDENLVMGDSGGYQIASGNMKWKPEHKETIFKWLENNTDIAMNLDIPPRLKYAGMFDECLDMSAENFKYFADNQSGKTKFLNIIQGTEEISYKKWYDKIKDFDFNGWSVGGVGSSLYRFMAALSVLLDGKEHLKMNNEYLHILGTSRIRDFLMTVQLQKSLEEIGSNMTVTTDSSSPDRAVVFGTFYTNFSINKARFESINFPNVQNHGDIVKEFLELKNQSWPYCTNFDNVLKEFITWQDLVDWNVDCTVGIRLHNFYLFKDAINQIIDYVYGHNYILKQIVDRDLYKVMTSIDEMVKSDNPKRVFEKYKPLYLKLSSSKKDEIQTESKFW